MPTRAGNGGVPVAAALAALEAGARDSAGGDGLGGCGTSRKAGTRPFTVTASPAPASPLSVTVTVAASGEFGVTAGTQTVPIPDDGAARR